VETCLPPQTNLPEIKVGYQSRGRSESFDVKVL